MKPEIAFGRVLRNYRNKIKYSQERLSSESGLDRTYISLLERGLRQPSLTSMLNIAKALKISPVEMMTKIDALHKENSKN